jgi:hypothetical protein
MDSAAAIVGRRGGARGTPAYLAGTSSGFHLSSEIQGSQDASSIDDSLRLLSAARTVLRSEFMDHSIAL